MKRCLFTLFALCTLLVRAVAVRGQDVVFSRADSLINAAVAEGTIPGAVLCVVQGDQILCNRAYGYRQVHPQKDKMKPGTIFDLASLSKVVGTGMTAMSLVDDGLLDPDAKVSMYLPEYEGDATVRDLLTHVSGLPAYAQWKTLLADHPDASKAEKKQLLLEHVCHCKRMSAPRTEFRYSCLNFITLQYVMEAITGKTLDRLAEERVFGPLKMTHTGYCPGPSKRIAPTEIQADSTCLNGVVHDPLARVMNSGVSGNAGVFAPAKDLAKLAIWMFRMLDDKKCKHAPFSRETLEQMLAIPKGYEPFGRALAWDMQSDYNAARGSLLSPETVCHTGYTGTAMVLDPENKIAVILLTNRVHPYDKGGVNTLRRKVTDAVAAQLLKQSQTK